MIRLLGIIVMGLLSILYTPKLIKYVSGSAKPVKSIVVSNGQDIAVTGFKQAGKAAIRVNPNRPYNRTAINEVFKIRRNEFHLEGLARGENGKSAFTDIYTGEKFIGGQKFDYDHIVSSHALFEKYKHVLTDRQIAELVNIKANIGPTMRPINKSKGKWDLLYWFEKSDASNRFGVKEELVKEQYQKANFAIEKKLQELLKENQIN
ncbi:hypothetical protein [Litoribacter populi]|uniref:hypothetical protein n=1 Tax=Litoribacter populi TaxID=2598460 RepID=UPI00117CEA5D|nr:hypothetical protein [Litoribacter populi]